MHPLNENDISATDKRALVDRIVASRAFSKSERLSSFLAHVCELDIQGRCDEISEQRIGQAVFGRPNHYDPAIDGIVRSHASRLRLRLDQYYAREGREESVRLRIPRGRYIPFYEQVLPSEEVPHQKASPETPAFTQAPNLQSSTFAPEAYAAEETGKAGEHAPGDTKRTGSRLPWILSAIFCIMTVCLLARDGGVSLLHGMTQQHPFWSKFFSPAQKTVIVAGDSSLAIWQELMRRNLGLAEYLSADYRTNAASPRVGPEQEAAYFATRRYTSIVDLEIIQSISRIAQTAKQTPEIRYARDLRPNDLKQDNIILIGTTETNPWVQLFEKDMNFVFFKDRVGQRNSIINRKPNAGEPSEWVYKEADEQHRVYGLVAYEPNIVSGKGVLILEGTGMAGTESARDFVTDDRQLLPFLAKIRGKDGEIPHFEVVLGTNNISGSAVKSSILAWRTTP